MTLRDCRSDNALRGMPAARHSPACCVQTFNCSSSNANQAWRFSSTAPNQGSFQLVGSAPATCITANASDGYVVVAPCVPGACNQTWAFTQGVSTQLTSGCDSSTCLNVNGNDINPGAQLITFPCNNGTNELFTLNASAPVVSIQGVQSGLCLDAGSSTAPCAWPPYADMPFCNVSMPLPDRVAALVASLTLPEKISQTSSTMDSIPRLGIPSANFWDEATHGAAPRGNVYTTMFAMPSLSGCSFNTTLWHAIGDVAGAEGRAASNLGAANRVFWAPNVNLVRDPRWGRAQEVPSELPAVAAAYATAFMTGFQQGEDPRYRRAVSTMKHFGPYDFEGDFNSNPNRMNFNANVTAQDMADTYLVPFAAGVATGAPGGVMCAYPSINGVPSCANEWLLTTVLRDAWGWDGYITGDCGAVGNVQSAHNYTHDNSSTAAAVVSAGVTTDCGGLLPLWLPDAIASGAVNESQIDAALTRLFSMRFSTGEFDAQAGPSPYNDPALYGASRLCTPAAQLLSIESVTQSAVLMKNSVVDSLPALPFQRCGTVNNVALIGPNANNSVGQLCSYYNGYGPCGGWDAVRTPLNTFPEYFAGVVYQPGCSDVFCGSDALFGPAVAAAAAADATVIFGGIDHNVAQEGVDRSDISLPGLQNELIAEVCAAAAARSAPCVLMLMAGSSLDISAPLANANVSAIMFIGYGGPWLGNASIALLFGDAVPAGRLSATWYYSNYTSTVNIMEMFMRPGASALPPYTNPGHTDRFFTGVPLLPFGFGLSYTTFSYAVHTPNAAMVSAAAVQDDIQRAYAAANVDVALRTGSGSLPPVFPSRVVMQFIVNVTNTGTLDADDVVMAFVIPPGAGSDGIPIRDLADFQRVFVPAGATVTVWLGVTVQHVSHVDAAGVRRVLPGHYALQAGVDTQALPHLPNQLSSARMDFWVQ